MLQIGNVRWKLRIDPWFNNVAVTGNLDIELSYHIENCLDKIFLIFKDNYLYNLI